MKAPGHDELFARDPLRIGGSQKERGGRDVLGLANSAQRRLRFYLLAEIALGYAGGVKSFRLDHSRVQRVDADLPRSQFFRERLCQGIHRPLGRTVNGASGRSGSAGDGADVDNAPAARTKVVESFL